MSSVNKVILIGNLGRDPETRYMPDGTAATNFSIATTESWKDKSGDKQEKTEWHRISTFRKLAEICGEYLKKGSQVYIEGKLQTRKWTDKDGAEKYATEVIADEMKMLGSRQEERSDTPKKQEKPNSAPIASKSAASYGLDNDNDDIPF